MIFSSLEYLIFLPLVVLVYWRTQGNVRLAWVIIASLFFYMSWLPIYGLLLLTLTSLNWLLGLGIANAQKGSNLRNPRSKIFLSLGLLLNLGTLCYYKYVGFFLSNLASSFNWGRNLLGANIPAWDAPVLNMFLPLGISFFTFEFVHYLVDIYRGDEPIKSWKEFAAFSAFFPSQIAGPIKRYQDFAKQLLKPEPWSASLFNEGTALIVQGLFKKVAIADPIGLVVNSGFTAVHTLGTVDALIATIGFVIQVYCDFSGYTDMGRGSALLLGIRLPPNFNLPYLSEDIGEFWRRWHMSLSYWLRDYVYIPLGGSRKDQTRTSFNLFVTMLACGLWHGASWHYVVFGAIQGLGLIVNRVWKSAMKTSALLTKLSETQLAYTMGIFVTMAFITASFTVFRAPSMTAAFLMFKALSGLNASVNCQLAEPLLKSGVIPLTIVYALFWLITTSMKDNKILLTAPQSIWANSWRWASWTAAIVLVIAASPTEAIPFVYFQF